MSLETATNVKRLMCNTALCLCLTPLNGILLLYCLQPFSRKINFTGHVVGNRFWLSVGLLQQARYQTVSRRQTAQLLASSGRILCLCGHRQRW